HLQTYRRVAGIAGKIWRHHGALEYCECAGEDLKPKWGTGFPKIIKARPGETVVFSWIVFKSRAHRDRVNARVMKDPRLAKAVRASGLPMDMRRMGYGGFKIIVEV